MSSRCDFQLTVQNVLSFENCFYSSSVGNELNICIAVAFGSQTNHHTSMMPCPAHFHYIILRAIWITFVIFSVFDVVWEKSFSMFSLCSIFYFFCLTSFWLNWTPQKQNMKYFVGEKYIIIYGKLFIDIFLQCCAFHDGVDWGHLQHGGANMFTQSWYNNRNVHTLCIYC